MIATNPYIISVAMIVTNPRARPLSVLSHPASLTLFPHSSLSSHSPRMHPFAPRTDWWRSNASFRRKKKTRKTRIGKMMHSACGTMDEFEEASVGRWT